MRCEIVSENPLIRLYHGDCMEALKGMKDNQYDLAIVDPEYGIGADVKHEKREYKSRKSATISNGYYHNGWDKSIPDDDYFVCIKWVAKNQIIWGANYFGLKGGFIYWDKGVTMPTYSDGELAYCSLINSVQSVKISWHGMIQQDMKNKEKRIHPTQKPVALYRWLLKKYSKPGETILDTHLGSASIAIACWELGHPLDGYELDSDYFDAAVKRVKAHISQGQIFHPSNKDYGKQLEL